MVKRRTQKRRTVELDGVLVERRGRRVRARAVHLKTAEDGGRRCRKARRIMPADSKRGEETRQPGVPSDRNNQSASDENRREVEYVIRRAWGVTGGTELRQA